MTVRFTALASGSAGNAMLVEGNRFGLLIDIGIGVRAFNERLADAGANWDRIHGCLLTHTHSDHWNDSTLGELLRRQIPLYCHLQHHEVLRSSSRVFDDLHAGGLIRSFESGVELTLAPEVRCRPLALRHDSEPTFGFRLDIGGNLFGEGYSIGYAADLGCWDMTLVEALTDVDLLAIEFNHDVQMECQSHRGQQLIMRVLGDEGHLSNEQAAALLTAVLSRSQRHKVGHVVQLHLSRECNRPFLAQEAALAALTVLGHEGEVHTARQDAILPPVELTGPPRRRGMRRREGGQRRREAILPQPWLPGIEPG